MPVAFGLSVTLPGIPVVFAGDEFGLTGDDGEHSRIADPVGRRRRRIDASIDLYRELIHLRRDHVALNEGGIRWLHADDDVLVFVREHEDESVLIVAARADFDVPGAAGRCRTALGIGAARGRSPHGGRPGLHGVPAPRGRTAPVLGSRYRQVGVLASRA